MPKSSRIDTLSTERVRSPRATIVAATCVGSAVLGLAWIPYTRWLLGAGLPFWWSGWLTPIFFLPILLAWRLQQSRRIPGLILVSELVAAGFAAALGPLGALSLHFGLAQGLLSEVVFLRSPQLSRVLLAAGVADCLLLWSHPALKVSHPPLLWLSHIAGVLASASLLGYLGDKVLRLSNRVGVLLFIAGFVWAPSSWGCSNSLLVPRIQDARFTVALDFDDTLVRTHGLLTRTVVPEAIDALNGSVSASGRVALQSFLLRAQRLTDLGTFPESYALEPWTAAPWSFPVDALPESLGPDPLARLQGFWASMAHSFGPIASQFHRYQVHEPTLSFVEQLWRQYPGQIEWAVVTSRTEAQCVGIADFLEPILRERPRVLCGKKYGKDSHAHAVEKLAHLAAPDPDRPPVRVFVDNDATVLEVLSGVLPELILLRALSNRIVPFSK